MARLRMARIRKALTPLVTGWIGWVALVLTSDANEITGSEWLAGGIVLATALGVYVVPNKTA